MPEHRLTAAVVPVTEIAEPRHNELQFVQRVVDRGGQDADTGCLLRQGGQALRARHHVDEQDVLSAKRCYWIGLGWFTIGCNI